MAPKRARVNIDPVEDVSGIPGCVRDRVSRAVDLMRQAMRATDQDSASYLMKRLSDTREDVNDTLREANCDKPSRKLVNVIMDKLQEAMYCRRVSLQASVIAESVHSEIDSYMAGSMPSEGWEEGKEGGLPGFLIPGRMCIHEVTEDPKRPGFKELLVYLQFCVRSAGLRRSNGDVYSRVVTAAGVPTIAWKRIDSVTRFFHESCRQDVNPRMWAVVAQPQDVIYAAAKYFETSADPTFPEIRRLRSMFSYENGVYLAETNEFHPYPLPPDHPLVTGGVSPAKHFAANFPVSEWERSKLSPDSWKDIPTPAVHSIFSYQEIPEEAIDMMYITVGRLIHPVGKLDKFGYVGWIYGVAGTGKSTFCNNLLRFWEEGDTGVMSNNCEPQFALYPLMDKFFFIAPEIRNDLKLSQAEWQGLATGDVMSCAIKHKEARSLTWTASSFWAGNEANGGSYTDNGGSRDRRRVLWKFSKKLSAENGALPALLEAELPSFILKSTVAYLNTISDPSRGNASVWNWIPEYFWKERKSVGALSNPLESFIINKIIKSRDSFVPLQEFKRSIREYCNENGFNKYRFDSDMYEAVFSDHGMSLGIKKYHGTDTKCVVGARLRTDSDGDAAQDNDSSHDKDADRDSSEVSSVFEK